MTTYIHFRRPFCLKINGFNCNNTFEAVCPAIHNNSVTKLASQPRLKQLVDECNRSQTGARSVQCDLSPIEAASRRLGRMEGIKLVRAIEKKTTKTTFYARCCPFLKCSSKHILSVCSLTRGSDGRKKEQRIVAAIISFAENGTEPELMSFDFAPPAPL